MTDWNKPDSADVLRPWLLVDPLTVYQAAILICGRAPGDMVGRPSAYRGWEEALRKAIRNGAISADDPEDILFTNDTWEERVTIRKADLCAWLLQNSQQSFFFLTPPDKWQNGNATDSMSSELAEKPLAARERNNLLRILRALVEMQELPAKGYAESIRAQLRNLEMAAPSDDTIRKAIEEARRLDS